MNALLFAAFLFMQQNALCDQLSTLDDYRHCILDLRVTRNQAYHDEIVTPRLGGLDTRVAVLESWQYYIKWILGIGGAGGVGLEVKRRHGSGGGKKKDKAA